jgi:hypothetical protein
MYVLGINPDTVAQLEIPNYVDNALGRVKAVNYDFACVSTPEEWQGDQLRVKLYFTANGRHSYRSDVTLRGVRSGQSASSLFFEAITEPEESE